MAPEEQQENPLASDTRIVLGADGSFTAGRLTRQQRRAMMRRESQQKAAKHVGVFTRPQRRWLARKVAREIDQAAGAAVAAQKRGDPDEMKRQEARLARAVQALD